MSQTRMPLQRSTKPSNPPSPSASVGAPDADVGDERRRRGAEGGPDGLAVGRGGVLAVGDVGVQVEEDPARRGSTAVVGWVAVPRRTEGGVWGRYLMAHAGLDLSDPLRDRLLLAALAYIRVRERSSN